MITRLYYTIGSRMLFQQTRSGGFMHSGLGLAVAMVAVISFLGFRVTKPITDQYQYITITSEQELAGRPANGCLI